jgi:hypothetical protein
VGSKAGARRRACSEMMSGGSMVSSKRFIARIQYQLARTASKILLTRVVTLEHLAYAVGPAVLGCRVLFWSVNFVKPYAGCGRRWGRGCNVDTRTMISLLMNGGYL